ncbi:uncharacterized protein LOC131957674 [Physella acuta]|uniref:uncharacterized protein LOC131957674 n=1 Tax=Physella acuta TaxID=109671 RepID=UPI0027DCD0CE|nr:uncharacterized protein LOC131957674 [Physella acuta]
MTQSGSNVTGDWMKWEDHSEALLDPRCRQVLGQFYSCNAEHRQLQAVTVKPAIQPPENLAIEGVVLHLPNSLPSDRCQDRQPRSYRKKTQQGVVVGCQQDPALKFAFHCSPWVLNSTQIRRLSPKSPFTLL